MFPPSQLSIFEVKVGDDFVPVQFNQLEVGDIFRSKNDPRQAEWDTYKGEVECVVVSQPGLMMEALSVYLAQQEKTSEAA